MSVASPPVQGADERDTAALSPDTGRAVGRAARRPEFGRICAAAAGGLLLDVAFPRSEARFPPHGLWWAAPVAVAVLALVVRGRRLRSAYGYGLVFSLGFLIPLLSWVRVAGLDGWLLLSLLQALVLAVVAPWCALGMRLRAWPLWIAAAWVGQEALRDRVPFGGFPWARLAFSQPDSPFTHLAALGGAPLVTFAVGLSGGCLALLVVSMREYRPRPLPRVLAPLGALALAVLVAVAGVVVPAPSGAGDPTATVAAVQGNVPRTGLDALGQKLQVTRNHVAETERLSAEIAAGRVPAPDLVLWPENSSDLDPFVSPTAADLLSSASRSVGRPILVGAVLQGPGPHQVRNAGLVWGPNGYVGPIYVKQHPVPFGEYLPGRAILERLVGRFADDLPSDFVPGHSTGVLPIAGPAGTYRLGDVICFEVAYDHLVRQPVRDGAQLLVVQTNNATFGRSGETYQQLAMSRLRAVEHGRSVVVVATSGVSAVIAPDGRIVRRTAVYTPDVLVAPLPLSSRQTIADRLGASVEWLLVGLAIGALLAGALTGRRGTGRWATVRRWAPRRRTRRGGRAA